MSAYCAPPPGNMNTTSGASATTECEKTRRGSFCCSNSAASAAVSATRTLRWPKPLRPSFKVNATSAKSAFGFAPRYSAKAALFASSAAREWPEIVNTWNGQSEGSELARAGASSTTTCALVPPTPSEFTPALLGPLPSGQAVNFEFTRKALLSKSITGFGAS